MIIRLPKNKTWTKDQDSDSIGSLVSTFNIDVTTNKGDTRVSPRMKIGTDDIADLGVATNFIRFNSTSLGFWTTAGSYVFKTTSVDASAAFAKDAQSGTPTTCNSDVSDIFFFRKANKLVVSTNNDIYYNSGAGSWSDVTGTALTTGTVHLFTEYGSRLYVTDNYKSIYSLDTSMTLTTSGTNTFNLGTLSTDNIGLFISKHLAASDRTWIFTINGAVGIPARVFTWDGATADTPLNSQGYVLDSGGVWSAVLIGDTPFIINTEARLQFFNGGTFEDVPNGRIPISKDKFLKNAFSSINNRPIHPNGMVTAPGNKIRIFLNNEYEDGTIDENVQSGIWEFDLNNKELGWYHINSVSLYAGSVTDYGQNRVARVGGLLYAKTTTGKGINLIGAQIYSDASTTKEVIATDDTDDTVQKYGYLGTAKFFSDNVTESWSNAWGRIKKLLESDDSVVIKYRVDEVEPTEVTITWTSTSVITSTGDLSSYAIGDEMEVTQGKGSGKSAHIVSIAYNAPTYTVELDDTFTGATSGTAKARFQKWIKATSFSGTNNKIIHAPLTGEKSHWVQFKICMQFTGKNELNDIIINSQADQQIT